MKIKKRKKETDAERMKESLQKEPEKRKKKALGIKRMKGRNKRRYKR